MVVDMRFLGVISLFILLAIVMTVRQFRMIVRMCVPVGSVLHLTGIVYMMGDVPVIVAVGHSRMRMLRLAAFALSTLLVSHERSPFLFVVDRSGT
jgi:hypothetical protein